MVLQYFEQILSLSSFYIESSWHAFSELLSQTCTRDTTSFIHRPLPRFSLLMIQGYYGLSCHTVDASYHNALHISLVSTFVLLNSHSTWPATLPLFQKTMSVIVNVLSTLCTMLCMVQTNWINTPPNFRLKVLYKMGVYTTASLC